MIRRHATAEDFTKWEEQAKKMTVSSLLYSIKDCRDVANNWKNHDPMVEGFYSDQAFTYMNELQRRRG